jgi:ATP-dependent RNA helicase DeaD
VKIKTRRLTEHVETIIGTEHYSEYMDLASQILGDVEPQVIVAALIKHFAKDELNIKAYKQIREAAPREESNRYERGGDRNRRGNDRDRRSNDSRFDRRDDRRSDSRDRDSAPRRRNSSSVRLFFAKGRADGMTPRALLEELKNDAGVESRRIDDIRILDNFSFFATNSDDAEQILAVYKRNKGAGKPMVDRARERDDR